MRETAEARSMRARCVPPWRAEPARLVEAHRRPHASRAHRAGATTARATGERSNARSTVHGATAMTPPATLGPPGALPETSTTTRTAVHEAVNAAPTPWTGTTTEASAVATKWIRARATSSAQREPCAGVTLATR